jgi:glycosyltransferase involved in cell wall biosynthesis
MKISKSTFTIEANGFADGPAQPFRDYLLEHGAKKVVYINHPLVAEGESNHVVTVYENGKSDQKIYRLPNKPPYTFAIDAFVPSRPEPTVAWFGFNNLAAYKGLRLKKAGKVEKVYYWAVDFVPNRFGSNPLTRVYNKLDKTVSMNVDARIELSQAAFDGRTDYLQLSTAQMAPLVLAPMGTWLSRTPKTDPQAWKKKRLVFMGHLVERQGVKTLLHASKALIARDKDIVVDIIGGGPLLGELKALAKKNDIAKNVTFHGFVKDYHEVEQKLAEATLAIAPYQKDPNNFTQFAYPGKLKAYLGAGLPIVLTDVPPNAHDFERAGVALIAEDNVDDIVNKVESVLTNPEVWKTMRKSALNAAKEFDWNIIFSRALKQLGFVD